jgi:hypothetical protein
MEVMVVTHKILTQEDARIEPTADLRINLLCVVHEFLELF